MSSLGDMFDSDGPRKDARARRLTTEEQRAWFLLEGGNLFKMNEAFEKVQHDGAEVYEIRGKKRTETGEFLLTVKARYNGHKIITWHGGSDMVTALAGAGKRLVAGTLKWREDLPYEERMQQAQRLEKEVAAGDVELSE